MTIDTRKTMRTTLSAGVLAAALIATAGAAFGQTVAKPQAPATRPPAKQVAPPKSEVPEAAAPTKVQPGKAAAHDHQGDVHGVQSQKLGVQQSDPNAPPPPPVIEFEELEHNFGTIDDTKPATHSFKFRNVTDRPVRITRVHASCGCTAARPSKDLYAPGEEGTINASFDPKNRKGRNDKTITVETDHPDAARILVKISSYVAPLVSVEPMKVFFPAMERGAQSTSILKVTGRSPGFNVTDVTSDTAWINTRVIGSKPVNVIGEEGRPDETLTEVEVELTLTGEAPVGRFQRTLTLTTNDSKASTHTVPIGGEVHGDLKPTPDRVQPRVQAPNTPFETQVRLESRSGQPFEIISLEVDGPESMSLVADYDPAEANGKPGYILKINGVTPPTYGAFTGSVTVISSLDDGEAISIPLFGNVFNRPKAAAAATPTQPKIAAPNATERQ